jgi:hypothetical protein
VYLLASSGFLNRDYLSQPATFIAALRSVTSGRHQDRRRFRAVVLTTLLPSKAQTSCRNVAGLFSREA